MKKKILSLLLSLMMVTSVSIGVFAYAKDPEETQTTAVEETTAPVETVAETAAETVADTQTEEVSPTDTEPSETVALDATEQENVTLPEIEEIIPTVIRHTEGTDESETAGIASDIDIYSDKKADDKVKKMEDEESDPTLKVFFIAIAIGLALGALMGYFLASYIIKRNTRKQHDQIYEAIRTGEQDLAEQRRKERDKEARQREEEIRKAEAKQKAEERKAEKEAKKQERAEKKAQAERERDEKKLRELQQKYSIQPQQPMWDPDMGEVEKLREENAKAEEEQKQFEQQQQEKVPQVSEVPADGEVEGLFEGRKMYYEGRDEEGVPYYTDPQDTSEEPEPFRLIDGKKVFYE